MSSFVSTTLVESDQQTVRNWASYHTILEMPDTRHGGGLYCFDNCANHVL
jgi:hypothetical protein